MTWYGNMEAETQGGKSKGKWNLTRKDKVWTGTVSYDDPQEWWNQNPQLSKCSHYRRASLAFSFTVEVGENTLEVKVSGDVTGESFSGNMEIKGYSNYPVKARNWKNRGGDKIMQTKILPLGLWMICCSSVVSQAQKASKGVF